MANVVTEETEIVPAEPVSTSTIRDAILALVPDDANIQRDIRIHDGVADISIKWRTLRWSTSMALYDQTPDQIATQVVTAFAQWVRDCIKNRGNAPRYENVVREMQAWARQNPEKAGWVHTPSKTEYSSEAVNA